MKNKKNKKELKNFIKNYFKMWVRNLGVRVRKRGGGGVKIQSEIGFEFPTKLV